MLHKAIDYILIFVIWKTDRINEFTVSFDWPFAWVDLGVVNKVIERCKSNQMLWQVFVDLIFTGTLDWTRLRITNIERVNQYLASKVSYKIIRQNYFTWLGNY